MRRVRFWLIFLLCTIARRRLAAVVGARVWGLTWEAEGLREVPREGGCVFALNHNRPGVTLDVLAVVLSALSEVRADVPEGSVIVSGIRQRRRRLHPVATWLRAVAHGCLALWNHHLIHITLGNAGPVLRELRRWRDMAAGRPVLVFPEGIAGKSFGAVRTNAGRWLGSFRVPVIPVAAFEGPGGGWTIRVGAPVVWSPRRDLHDVQLGLAVAALLPPEMAPDWQGLLGAWRGAHVQRPSPEGVRPCLVGADTGAEAIP